MKDYFPHLAAKLTQWAGSAWATLFALAFVIAWCIGGFFIGFGNTGYEFVANTATTLSTFVMIFIVQNTQNREAAATQVKLDALLKTDPDDTDDIFIGIEDLTEPELTHLKQRIREEADAILARRKE